MIQDNLPAWSIVDADFTYANERSSLHYQLPAIDGVALRRVSLPKDSSRGGLLTQASVLKVTANGTYTSPVTRGVWILDRILGTPPSPPPENVAGLVPDIRGATTIREQLEKHRHDDACASCHVEIDPPGFALESFDVIGGWRDHYRLAGWARDAEEVILDGRKMHYYKGAQVDATGTLPDGRVFQNIDEFKQLLLADKDQLARALTNKLVTYSTGTAPRLADEPQIETIVARVRDRNYGFRTLVHEVVDSDFFRQK